VNLRPPDDDLFHLSLIQKVNRKPEECKGMEI